MTKQKKRSSSRRRPKRPTAAQRRASALDEYLSFTVAAELKRLLEPLIRLINDRKLRVPVTRVFYDRQRGRTFATLDLERIDI
jgi:hypothetical protein